MNYKRFLSIVAPLAFVLLLGLFLHKRPRTSVSPSVQESIQPMASLPLPVKPEARRAIKPIKKAMVQVIPEADPSSFRFHVEPKRRNFNYTFSGKTFCSMKPCEATIQLSLETANFTLHRQAQTKADGSFSIDLPFTEISTERADWKVIALAQEYKPAEETGHRILMDELSVSIPLDFSLQ